MWMLVQVLNNFVVDSHPLRGGKTISRLKDVTAHYLCFYLEIYLIVWIRQR